MAGKIPADAFDFYFGLGAQRSYQAVADRYQVSKRAVTKLAAKEHWQERVEELEKKARQTIEQKAVENLGNLNDRHLKLLRVIQARALETLKSMPLKTAMDAVRALDLSIRQERLLLALEDHDPQKPSSAPSTLSKLCAECPRWITDILACTIQWGEGDPRSSGEISDLATEISNWLDGLIARGLLDASLHLHELLLKAFQVEDSIYRRTKMEEKLLQLEQALKEFQKKNQIDPGDRFEWEILGAADMDDPRGRRLQWSEAFGSDLANDPLTFVARSMKSQTETRDLA
jgi:tetratricopeptide (TPR) repeat protein